MQILRIPARFTETLVIQLFLYEIRSNYPLLRWRKRKYEKYFEI